MDKALIIPVFAITDAQRDGDILLFLNNDTEIINNDWLTSMVGFFSRPEVGMVGAKLLFPDNLVQHGGIWVSPDRVGYYSELLSHRDGGYMETMRYFRLRCSDGCLPDGTTRCLRECWWIR